MDTVRLKKHARRVVWLARKGQRGFSAKLVVALLVHPLLEVLDTMEQTKGERWLTLREAARRSGRGKNYFEKPLVTRDGKCRLELWKAEGLADKTEDGWWLISPLVVAGARQDVARNAPEPDLASEVNDIASRFAA